MSDVEIIGTPERTVSRRIFIKGVIAAGATTSSASLPLQGLTTAARGAGGSRVRGAARHAGGQRPAAPG